MDQQRLGQTRDADKQTMPASKQGVQNRGDDFLLPDDHSGDFCLEQGNPWGELIQDRSRIRFDERRRLYWSTCGFFKHKRQFYSYCGTEKSTPPASAVRSSRSCL